MNGTIFLDTKCFSSCLVKTKGKFDLLLFTVVKTVQFITFHEYIIKMAESSSKIFQEVSQSAEGSSVAAVAWLWLLLLEDDSSC